MIHPVILSGGSGTRLWPRSRSNTPKQFLPLVGDDTLFQATARRVAVLRDTTAVLTVCAEDHRFMVGEQLQAIGLASGGILLEPVARNTAPAIALAALHVLAVDPDGVLLVLPADHLIRDEPAFHAAVRAGLPRAIGGALVTFGIRPEYAETGYGYIRIGESLGSGVHAIDAFVEKPDAERARGYLAGGDYLWNSGMFLFRADAYLAALAAHAPAILDAAREAYARAKRDLDFIRVDAEAFARSPSDSIDYAVMERAADAAVVPVDCGWSDVGSWSSLWSVGARDADGNVQLGDTLAFDTRDSYLQAADDRLVAALGVRDLIVVDTADAVLVAHRDRVQDVKKLVDRLKAEGRTEHLHHRKVYRPWGSYDSLSVGEGFQVKRIVVKPGAALSLQRHRHRAEHWVVVSGRAEVTCDERVFELRANQSTYIPQGSVHRLRNASDEPVELIEVQSGGYLGEDDIERLEDVYGRS
ncbi:mannose-1-phosphate guanylyltransferase/mannose-6-phosphate isomerase [Lysobacter pythonis]|uniref:Xanthan biosynthesis protein XanB n=1 Tax=Solilutibacter pythonis TaxID=2483112 RepID=A0A3M2I2B8_9GAMM|nr:mannose-1-phosphate guanylyltransferase/mannose-6-phosphate isomerase [Lysobacter pythonis]RMH93332.1 mannose-1-phosphate guanylyltransferase/mannose-6-phosphate isomerase [Lysobacter pythonis]